ncbi:MAG: bifunctional diaminohydroxyphosphoribosylaminopyrimidine deaminase/5-amino-6-(5-phosphoribosylamino)uracil reductase RibD [Cyanobacteria bacterium SZAS LIN-3]|nr:bifunctional diaminohydroxyphosphoribosylaminopyrimidine deaminase/5-amino-6-(5-phosphoribosylamino)uracil reductase RibD [Cyanobacteria bacterium SZAS LIN-3]MBS2006466.1 bifunctional diaminohydroxyphosphoribosylaminopyrimidine deaminase/5-amino-6-(5-phosphoribosylamino)uracil reductase RibD [Cyanobacteria bacterium SZAS TMP-1]
MAKVDEISDDERYMRRCLELASRAEGQTSPNPLVGCVVLDKNGLQVGQGYHARAGESHAEVYALDMAGEAAKGGTLYCSLEPCCHHGRTPPCSDRVIKSGVSRVVIGLGDPNPKVDGGGIKALRDAGIEVECGLLEKECRFQNRAFLKAITKSMPWVSLKMAVTLDGRIADREGHSQWITGEGARDHVMLLRSQSDAIMIGAATALADNASLTVRLAPADVIPPECSQNPDFERIPPAKVLLDPTLSLPPDARLFDPLPQECRTIIFCLDDQQWLDRAPSAYPSHVEVMPVARAEAEGGSLELAACLRELHKRRINRVICEGGGRLAGQLLAGGLVDELYWFVAPKILGDSQARPSVAGEAHRRLADIANYRVVAHTVFGPDILIHALVNEP